MAFPSNPTPGQEHTENDTIYVYGSGGWWRKQVGSNNDSSFPVGGGGGSAVAAGAAGEIQFTDGTNLDASPDFSWDDTGKVLGINGDINLDDGGSFTTTIQTVTPTANRTISYPDATGTLALVGGSSTQVLYNASGALAGISTLTFDGTTLTTAGRFVNSYTSLASSPAKAFTGTWFTGGSATTTKPHFLIEPSGTTSTAWSTSGTGLGVNAASGFAGNLLDLQVEGATQARMTSAGKLECARIGGVGANFNLDFTQNESFRFYRGTGSNQPFAVVSCISGTARLALSADTAFGWTASAGTASFDLALARDAANTLAQRNSTNAQTLRVYGTYAGSGADYVRASLSSSSTAVTLAAETAGTGADDVPLNLTAAGTGTVKVNSVAEVAVSSTVAGLPATPAVGMLTRVTDASAPAVGSTVAGGGAAAALVWWNGANWTVIGV
jgi:hypothetical protein